MKIPILEVPEKHPKLVLMFEKETSKKVIFKKSGKITKQFKYWLRQKIKYKTLICKDPNCPDYGKEFPSKKALTTHLNYHKRGYRDKMIKAHNTPEAKENHLKAMKEAYKRPKVRERRSKVSKEVHNRPGVKEKKSKLMEELYSRPEYRENISNKMKEV